MRDGITCAALLGLACAGLALQSRAAPPPALTPPAEANYMLNCMGCHVTDGSGAAGKVPSMRDSLAILSASPAGRSYLVRVPGAAQSMLTNGELAQLLNWMVRNLSAKPAPADFIDFTAEEVAGYRATPLVDVRGTRARLLTATSRVPQR
jgi:mono/diheme cytochrome c family protein